MGSSLQLLSDRIASFLICQHFLDFIGKLHHIQRTEISVFPIPDLLAHGRNIGSDDDLLQASRLYNRNRIAFVTDGWRYRSQDFTYGAGFSRIPRKIISCST